MWEENSEEVLNEMIEMFESEALQVNDSLDWTFITGYFIYTGTQ
ncbi:MAG: hypothetical protein ACRC6X_02805 [Culicoidibacterales bacterium]